MDIPEMFLLADAILIGLDNVSDGLVVYPARIRSRFLEELPFMVTETVSKVFLVLNPISLRWDWLKYWLEATIDWSTR